jgi:membrane protein YqaA with SNARE-associated domain
MEHFAEYAGLFGAALLAATILPAQSEVILFAMLLTDLNNA